MFQSDNTYVSYSANYINSHHEAYAFSTTKATMNVMHAVKQFNFGKIRPPFAN